MCEGYTSGPGGRAGRRLRPGAPSARGGMPSETEGAFAIAPFRPVVHGWCRHGYTALRDGGRP